MSDEAAPPSEWGQNTFEHEFSTGRTAVLRRHTNIFALATDTGLGVDMVAGEHDPDVKSGEVVLAIIQQLWVRPRVLGLVDKPARGAKAGDEISFVDLDTSEIIETLGIWGDAAERAARFREESAGAGGRANGKGVGSAAKRPARPAARKPRGAAR